jgi:outer membrane biosynthesis protein TonB
VGKDGRVTEAEVIDGDPVLTSLAIDAVKEWLFQPGLSNGEPTEAFTEVEVIFESKKVRK